VKLELQNLSDNAKIYMFVCVFVFLFVCVCVCVYVSIFVQFLCFRLNDPSSNEKLKAAGRFGATTFNITTLGMHDT
jgi:hypothetical protein